MLTETNVVNAGLTAIRMRRNEIDSLTEHKRQELFKTHFGPSPAVCLLIWNESAAILEAPSKMKFVHLLWGLHFLRCYPTEQEMALTLRKSIRTIRKWVWEAVARIQLLLPQKVCCCL